MGEEIDVENGRIADFQGLVTLTLDRAILHTVMHHSSTSTYTPNFVEIEEIFCGRTDGRVDGRVDGHLRPTLLGRLRGVDLITNAKNNTHLWIIIRLAFKTVCHYACFEGEICPKLGKTSLIPTWGGRRSRTTTNIRIWKLFCALSVTYSISSRFNSLMSGKFSPKHTLVLVKLATKCFHE